MTAKDLERLIARRGGSPAALDIVTRKLREGFSRGKGEVRPFGLNKAGRGVHGHQLKATEVVYILLCYAGSDVASQCADRLVPLVELERAKAVRLSVSALISNSFAAALADAVSGEPSLEFISEVRIARNRDFGRVVLTDGRIIAFAPKGADPVAAEAQFLSGYTSEGVIPQGLLREISAKLTADA